PPKKGEARTFLLAGELSADGEGEPSIYLEAMESGYVKLVRTGVEGVNSNGAVSLAVRLEGFDVVIEERLVKGREDENATPVNSAEFLFDFFGRELYHIRYQSESTGLFAVATLNNRPGYKVSKPLSVKS
ncbi:MAG: hypothetical protein IK053_05370, partial [Muribaculaceae bacterium]|nr:hypothetical protein [Muribaculaceae bacterium]